MQMQSWKSGGWKSRFPHAAAGMALTGALLTGCGSNASREDDVPETNIVAASTPAVSTPSASTPAPDATANVASATPGTPAQKLPAGWQKFTSSNGGYSVWMPGKTETKVTPVTTELGTIPAQVASSSTQDSAYLVIHADYPEAMAKADAQKILDGARSGAVQRVQGQLQSEKKITINGFPGREFSAVTATGEEKRFIKARIYLVRRRLYQQIVVVPQDKKPVEEINTFLNSFKIQAKKE